MNWDVVKRYIDDRIDVLKDRLTHNLSAEQTTFVRGEIAAYREILQLPESTVAQQGDVIHAVRGRE